MCRIYYFGRRYSYQAIPWNVIGLGWCSSGFHALVWNSNCPDCSANCLVEGSPFDLIPFRYCKLVLPGLHWFLNVYMYLNSCHLFCSWWDPCNNFDSPMCSFPWYNRWNWVSSYCSSSELVWHSICRWCVWILLCWAFCVSKYLPING